MAFDWEKVGKDSAQTLAALGHITADKVEGVRRIVAEVAKRQFNAHVEEVEERYPIE